MKELGGRTPTVTILSLLCSKPSITGVIWGTIQPAMAGDSKRAGFIGQAIWIESEVPTCKSYKRYSSRQSSI